ncbi:MAG: hypothetical protein ACI8ZM_001756 [Crocinitomix sp.]|jgi:hypothetical protein
MHDHEIDDLFHSGVKNQHFEIKDVYTNDLVNRLKTNQRRVNLFWFVNVACALALVIGVCYTFLNSKENSSSTILFNSSLIFNQESDFSNSLSLAEMTDNREDMFHSSKGDYSTTNVLSDDKEISENPTLDNVKNIKVLALSQTDIAPNNEQFNKVENERAFLMNELINPNAASVDNSNQNNNEMGIIKAMQKIAPVEDHSLKWESKNDRPLIDDNIKDSIFSKSEKIDLVEQDTTTMNQDLAENANHVIESPQKNKNVNLLLSAEMGINFNSAKYTGIESDYYKTNNRDKTTMNYEFNAGVLVRDKFSIGVGIGINEQKYEYDYNTSLISYDTIQFSDSAYVLDYYIYGGGVIVDSVYYYDHFTSTAIDSITSITNFKGITQAKYVTIPLHAGYYFTHNKFMLGLLVTARVNILQNAGGGYYNNNSFELFNSSNNPLFKKSYLSFSFKTQINYNIHKNFFITSSIGYSPYSKPLIESSILERKTQLINASFGLTYKL